MKTLFFDPTPENVATFEADILSDSVPPEDLLAALKLLIPVYEANAARAIGTDFTSYHLSDETGVLYEDIRFVIEELPRRDGDLWVVGSDFQVNFTKLNATFIELVEGLVERASNA